MQLVAAVRRSTELLPRRDRRIFGLAVVAQTAVSFLDLLGVLLVGLVVGIGVSTSPGTSSLPVVGAFQNEANARGVSDEQLILMLAAAAGLLFVSKSAMSAYILRRTLRFLGARQARLSAELASRLMSRPVEELGSRTSQGIAYAMMTGAGQATVVLLGQASVAVSEVFLLTVLTLALLIIDPLTTVLALGFLVSLAVTLQLVLGRWSSRVGTEQARADIASLDSIQTSIATHREMIVLDRLAFATNSIGALRLDSAKAFADQGYIQALPKYIFEAALIVGAFGMAAVLVAVGDLERGVALLAIFVAAGSRMLPSLLRLQGAALQIRGAQASAQPTFALAEDLGVTAELNKADHPLASPPVRLGSGLTSIKPFVPRIRVSDVSFRYQDTQSTVLSDVSLAVEPGEHIVIMGPSGAGKSTLLDVILGLVEPTTGGVEISGLPARIAYSRWPGKIAYVPQATYVSASSVAQNVALGLPRESINEDQVRECLSLVRLDEVLRKQKLTLDSSLGEDARNWSGGQRQRLGLARALYSRPQLLVLDEATSALDQGSETLIGDLIRSLGGGVTTISVTHRVASIRGGDRVLILQEGTLHERVEAPGPSNTG